VDEIRLKPGTLLQELPIFPLPHVAFFPNTLLPLHVFEPRYMAMIHDVCDGDRLLGIVQLLPGWEETYYGTPSIHPVLGIGEIVHRAEVPGDRANILVRGITRARIVAEGAGCDLYRTVTVEILDSDRTDSAQTAHRLATVRYLFSRLLSEVDGVDVEGAEALFAPDADPSVVVDAIASALPIKADAKQTLLAELNVPRRADRLADLLVNMGGEQPPASAFSVPS
jgi:Lon protease-like protein